MKTFGEVAECGSFSMAARNLGLSKAAVSKQISDLEADLESQLFVRTTRRVRLTTSGHAYFERCRQLFDELADIESQVRDSDDGLDGVLRVAGPQTFSELYLSQAIEEFLRRHERVRVDMILTDQFVDLVAEGIDVGIRISELDDSSLVAKRLASTSIVACAAPAYLREHGIPQHPTDLKEHRLILDTNFRNPGNWRFRDGGRMHSVRVDGRFTVNSAIMARDMVLAGAGIALLPEFVVRDEIISGDIEICLEPFQAYDIGVYAIYPCRFAAASHGGWRLR